MVDRSNLLSSLPDAPLTTDAVASLDDADGIRRADPILVKGPGGRGGPDEEHTDDVLLATGDRICYLSREIDDGWVVVEDEPYDEDEFEAVFDDVRTAASRHAEAKRQAQTEFALE